MDPKEEIRSRVDIADLISEYLDLKPAGSGSFKALCPFHSEKTPSFHVSKEKQIWHCFGCNEGGDCFSFLMKMDGLDFPEALRVLGKKVGVDVLRFTKTASNQNQRLVAVNEFAAACYHKILQDAPNATEPRAYAERRGLSMDLLEKFMIGYAPDAWDVLANYLEKKGFRLAEVEQAGLVMRKKSGAGYIDRFRNRLMIPLRDAHGNVVAFTGRLLPLPSLQPPTSNPQPPTFHTPKYMNSPETAVYHKGEFLFGLDLAKRAIKEQKAVIVVEGNLDVVASHKAGVEHVVASSGTALTDRQLDLLKRLTDTLIFAFDQDAAGFHAARRGMQLARAKGFQIQVALLPQDAGKDPDEAVQKDPELWRTAVYAPVSAMQYLIDYMTHGRTLTDVGTKREIGAVLLPEIACFHNVIEREHWLQVVADILRTPRDVLRDALRQVAFSALPSSPMAATRARSEGQTPSSVRQPSTRVHDPMRTRAHAAAESLLALFLHVPHTQSFARDTLTPMHFPEGAWRELYSFLFSGYPYERFSPSADQPSYFSWVSGILKGEPTHEYLLPMVMRLGILGETWSAANAPSEVPRHVAENVEVLEWSLRDAKRKAFEANIRQAEARGDHETVEKLLKDFNSLR
jgi:DNA primase